MEPPAGAYNLGRHRTTIKRQPNANFRMILLSSVHTYFNILIIELIKNIIRREPGQGRIPSNGLYGKARPERLLPFSGFCCTKSRVLQLIIGVMPFQCLQLVFLKFDQKRFC